MKRLLSGSVACALLLTAATSTLGADSAQLGSAKVLYAQASYEDALVQLNAVTDADSANEVDQYRALCLLALGRDDEAQASLERLVARAPLYTVKEDDASPKLVTLFQQVRQRALPGAARDLYAKARANFDEKHFAEAGGQFEELLAVLKDAVPADSDSTLGDLKDLAEGFLKLTSAALTPPAAPPPAPLRPAPTPATPPNAPPVRPPTPVIYTLDDRDVVPPVDIIRELPPWQPPPGFTNGTFRGALQVDIDEHGLVERAAVVEPITPLYDAKLVAAAKHWRFQPATKNGVPVKFRKSIAILLSPPSR
jgi:tetratricopeptide (TPR) repeat protein